MATEEGNEGSNRIIKSLELPKIIKLGFQFLLLFDSMDVDKVIFKLILQNLTLRNFNMKDFSKKVDYKEVNCCGL